MNNTKHVTSTLYKQPVIGLTANIHFNNIHNTFYHNTKTKKSD